MTPLPITVAALFLTMKSFSGAFSSNSPLGVREVKMESVIALSGYFGIKFLSSAFDMQFHIIVASILLKMCVNYFRDNSGQLLRRRISLVCIMALLLVSE